MGIPSRRKRRVVVWRRSDHEDGSVLVEFALVFPIFAIMLFGMIQFGLVFNGWTSLRDSVQSAARLGSINDLGSDCSSDTSGSCNCPQGNDALTGGVNQDTANMICTVSEQIGQPLGITGTPQISLLVQNGLLTACSQVQADPFTGVFPMTVSTASSFYIEQPGTAPLSATVDSAGISTVTSSNNTLTYDIVVNGAVTPVDATIAPGTYDPNDLGVAIQTAINTASTGQHQYQIPSVAVQNNISMATATIEFTVVPELNDPVVEMDDTGGSATTAGTGVITFLGTSTDNDLLESYNNPVNTPTLAVSAPSTDVDGVEMTISAQLLGATSCANGTITFDYFQQTNPPTNCTTGATGLGTATVSGDGTYTVNFTPIPPAGAGNYWWYASYTDPEGLTVNSLCGSTMPETVVP